MSTRHLVAYGLIAALAAAGFVFLWVAVLRQRLALGRRRRRFHRDRRRAAATPSVRDTPAFEAD